VHLLLLGVSHRTAPVDLRERLDFASRDVGAAVESLAARSSATESVVLSTCNRSEIYVANAEPTRAREELIAFLSDYHHLPRDVFLPHLFAHEDTTAAHHLFRVAAGLDSLVIGEPQILGQVKDAFQAAALRSLIWLENVEPHLGLDPIPFTYKHMMRSQRIGYARHAHELLFGFASAIILALVALMIGYESVTRILRPVAIDYDEALLIAALGLAVNLVSAWLLGDDGHAHGDEEEAHHHHDHNHRAAYLHVLADAITSVLAIGGLLAARFFSWVWIDPVVGIIGSL
jgi:hypothetical protein